MKKSDRTRSYGEARFPFSDWRRHQASQSCPRSSDAEAYTYGMARRQTRRVARRAGRYTRRAVRRGYLCVATLRVARSRGLLGYLSSKTHYVKMREAAHGRPPAGRYPLRKSRADSQPKVVKRCSAITSPSSGVGNCLNAAKGRTGHGRGWGNWPPNFSPTQNPPSLAERALRVAGS